MDNIARALVISIQYLGEERNDDEFTEDDDLKIVEEATYLVQNATEEEKEALRKTASELGFGDWAQHIGI